jgi:TRAP-type C4-dicarboxylate transport system permease small subunit
VKLRKLLDSFFNITDKIVFIGGHFGAALVVIILFLTMYEITLRYVFNNAPMIADEIAAYMLVAVVAVGLAYRWREGGHVRVEALVSRLPPKAQYWLRLFTLTVTLFFTVLTTVGSFTVIGRTMQYGLMSNSWLRIPLIWPQLFIPFGFILLSAYILGAIYRHLLKRKEFQAADWRSLDE